MRRRDAMPRSTILFAGGGTGGHLYPGLAVAEALQHRIAQGDGRGGPPDLEVGFVGSRRPIEERILSAQNYAHHRLDVASTQTLRSNPLRFVWTFYRSLRTAHRLLADTRPALVVGLGGFASVPLLQAAQRRGIPTIVLEQNAVPGRATRWLCRRAAKICVALADSTPELPRHCAPRTHVTGNPIRREICELHQREPAEEQPTLLVIGGSQGASAVNAAAAETVVALANQLQNWQVVHQTGDREAAQWATYYDQHARQAVVHPFLDDLPYWYSRAQLVISRAGATSLAELACAGCPTLLIPLPGAIYNHQHHNARIFADAGAAGLIEQSRDPAVTAHDLTTAARNLLESAEKRDAMRSAMWSLARPRAATTVADLILNALDGQVAES